MTNSDATVINDRYEIQKRVGRGGMADVFLARDLLLDRQVAIKVLFPEYALDPNFVERFRREAQSAANLSHPNIVNVYDWGQYEGTYFIAMEYVQGRTLAEILKTNKQLTSKQAAEIASEVAAALGFAHEGHLAHRDIKPANILIGSNGQVKVADFGIARAMNSATESNLTQAGSVMGTASYFSPEQAQGAQPDPRSDLYSLGIVMYEMVAGRPPFTGENPVSIAYKQVHDQPQPINKIVPDIPRPFEAIVAKLLAKDPKLRYPSAHALRDDLRRFRSGEQVQALVSAAAAAPRTAPAAKTAGVAATTAVAASAATRVMPGEHQATTVAPRQPTMGQYPPGASPEAHYYEDSNSRTGWYALAAFIALIALVAGGVLLFQSLNKEEPNTSAVVLPDLTNMSLDDATAILTDLGLPFKSFPEENQLVPEEFVHRTDPAAGTVVPAGTPIQLFYRPSLELKAVPIVVGLPIGEARIILGTEGFQINEITEESEIESGIVIRTDPEGDTPVKQDTIITVVVSSGPNQVAIPSIIINDPVEEARSLLESSEYGLVVVVENVIDDLVEVGLVVRTNPEPGSLVNRGSTVTLFVSSGPGQVTMPPLVGNPEGQATNLLRELGLKEQVSYRDLEPGDANDGLVIQQSVNAGVPVDKGTTVRLVVGRATAPATTTSTTTTTTTTLPPTTTAPAPTTTAPAPTTTATVTTVGG